VLNGGLSARLEILYIRTKLKNKVKPANYETFSLLGTDGVHAAFMHLRPLRNRVKNHPWQRKCNEIGMLA
jgi:hypothetical protein